MPSCPTSLPDNIDALKALLMQRDGEVQQLRDTVTTLKQALNVRIPRKLDTRSATNWTLIPAQTGHLGHDGAGSRLWFYS